ncbi:hypothetical protein EI94DRAFT_1813245 [Lactarius quietus]|nr:hypothetical protein EI94DRAFT_1813245 [Lactarius quietus]
MSSNVQSSTRTPNFQQIFNEALEQYKKKTGKVITTQPLAEEINRCGFPDDVLTVLQGKANELNQSQSVDQRLTRWLTLTVNVLNALSVTVGPGVGTVSSIMQLHHANMFPNDKFRYFPPTKIIFSGINILLVVRFLAPFRCVGYTDAISTKAARDTAASHEALIELFDRIENFFERLQTYTEISPTRRLRRKHSSNGPRNGTPNLVHPTHTDFLS